MHVSAPLEVLGLGIWAILYQGDQAESPKPGDTWKTIRFNFGAKPVGSPNAEVDAFNGVPVGNGHLTGKNAAPATKPAEAVS